MNVFCLARSSERFRSLAFGSERSLGRVFFLLIDSSHGPISEYFIYRLAPGFQTTASFYSFNQIQQNQHPLLRYDLHYPVKQLKHVFESSKI